MIMNNKTRIILIILCVLLIVASGCGIAFALMNSSLVSAEYLDLADTNTMLNFNQLVKDEFTHNYQFTYSGSTRFLLTNSSLNIPTSHKFFVKIISDEVASTLYFNYSTGIVAVRYNISGNFSDIFTSNGIVNDISIAQGSNKHFDYIVIIDLTQMFGSGNEPNLQQAQDYFTADYYNYTAGTPMPYSKTYLQGYHDAAKDIYSSMNVTYNAYTIGTNSFNYWNNSVQAGSFEFDSVYSAYTFSGVLGINLSAEIQANTTISFDFELYIPDLQGEDGNAYKSYPLYIAYVDENNNLTQFNKIAPTLTNEVYTLSYKQDVVLPVNTSVIYIYLNYAATGSNTYPTGSLCFKSAMTFTTTDIGLLMNNAYQRGADDTNKLYADGTERYNAIYNTGYTNALATQNATLGAMGYISAAFTNVGEILQIELLPGIPISIFLLFPLMLGLITLVVKLTKGD